MSFEIIATFVVLGVAMLLFLTEWIPAGQTSLLAACALLVLGVIDQEQLFEGFTNDATVTVTGMFVVSAALFRSGAVNAVGDLLARLLERGQTWALAGLTSVGGILSAFINNTSVVAILLPIVTRSSRRADRSASRLLMPLSFAAMLGGTITLIGTSTNLVVSSIAVEEGLEPISMFELAPVGLALFGVGVLYLLTVGQWLVPSRRGVRPLEESYEVKEYVTDLRIAEGCSAVGASLGEAPMLLGIQCEILGLWRDDEAVPRVPQDRDRLSEGDILRLHCAAPEIEKLIAREGSTLEALTGLTGAGRVATDEMPLVEAVLGPGSPLVGHTVEECDLREQHGAVVVAVRRQAEVQHTRLGALKLRAGDVLLLCVERASLDQLEVHGDFTLISETTFVQFRRRKIPVVLAILAAVVGLAALDVFSISAAALMGVVAVLLSRSLQLDEAVDAVDWNIVMILAGVVPLGSGMVSSGAADLLAQSIASILQHLGPRGTVAGLFVVTGLITSLISNSAAAALLTPVAFSVAAELEILPRALVMTIAFGASTALLTPVGYQTNTMVYGAGRYRFWDFARVGAPLMVLLTAVVAWLVPELWPLR
ncbi:MAG: SLC13 family permease [Deltaproteobacteria bacterium]|nr:SLC13 family permease [Deltaproteobacteria bacterium]